MNTRELANLLNGREYRSEITKEEIEIAKAHNLVVVFGYSDDGMWLRGATYGNIEAYDGGKAYITPDGLLENKCDFQDCPYYAKAKETAKEVSAAWDNNGYSWFINSEIPFVPFDIMEDGEKYCRNIVFSLDDVGGE